LIKVKEIQGDGFPATYIQRVDTEGGAAPAKAPEKAGEEARVKYKATYVFYVPGKGRPGDRTVPEAVTVPTGHKAAGELDGEGVQVYESKAKAGGGFEWALKGPEADLSDNGKKIGKHHGSPAGPVWEIGEGDKALSIVGEVAKKAEAKGDDLAWLLIEVKD